MLLSENILIDLSPTLVKEKQDSQMPKCWSKSSTNLSGKQKTGSFVSSSVSRDCKSFELNLKIIVVDS